MINILSILIINNITTKTKRNKILIHKSNIWKEEEGYKTTSLILNKIVSSELDIKTNILLLEYLFFYGEVK